MGLGLGLGVAAMAQMRSSEAPSLTAPQGLSQPQRFETSLTGGATAVDGGERRFGSGTAGGGQNDLSKVQSFFYR